MCVCMYVCMYVCIYIYIILIYLYTDYHITPRRRGPVRSVTSGCVLVIIATLLVVVIIATLLIVVIMTLTLVIGAAACTISPKKHEQHNIKKYDEQIYIYIYMYYINICIYIYIIFIIYVCIFIFVLYIYIYIYIIKTKQHREHERDDRCKNNSRRRGPRRFGTSGSAPLWPRSTRRRPRGRSSQYDIV